MRKREGGAEEAAALCARRQLQPPGVHRPARAAPAAVLLGPRRPLRSRSHCGAIAQVAGRAPGGQGPAAVPRVAGVHGRPGHRADPAPHHGARGALRAARRPLAVGRCPARSAGSAPSTLPRAPRCCMTSSLIETLVHFMHRPRNASAAATCCGCGVESHEAASTASSVLPLRVMGARFRQWCLALVEAIDRGVGCQSRVLRCDACASAARHRASLPRSAGDATPPRSAVPSRGRCFSAKTPGGRKKINRAKHYRPWGFPVCVCVSYRSESAGNARIQKHASV